MRHADLLAALRKPRNDDDIKAQLQAMTVPMHEHDPICVILDRAIRAMEDLEESLRAVAEMRADDLDNKRLQYQDRGEYDNQTERVHGWLSAAVVS